MPSASVAVIVKVSAVRSASSVAESSPLLQVMRRMPGAVSASSQVASKPKAPKVFRNLSSSSWRVTTGCARPWVMASADRFVRLIDQRHR